MRKLPLNVSSFIEIRANNRCDIILQNQRFTLLDPVCKIKI